MEGPCYPSDLWTEWKRGHSWHSLKELERSLRDWEKKDSGEGSHDANLAFWQSWPVCG